MKFRIVKLRSWRDAIALRRIEKTLFAPAELTWKNNNPDHHWWQVLDAWGLVGFAGVRLSRCRDGTTEAHFVRCGVLKRARGRGLQRRLIRVRLAWCRGCGIRTVRTYTWSKNKVSSANLRACGFRGRRSRDGKWNLFRKEIE